MTLMDTFTKMDDDKTIYFTMSDSDQIYFSKNGLLRGIWRLILYTWQKYFLVSLRNIIQPIYFNKVNKKIYPTNSLKNQLLPPNLLLLDIQRPLPSRYH